MSKTLSAAAMSERVKFEGGEAATRTELFDGKGVLFLDDGTAEYLPGAFGEPFLVVPEIYVARAPEGREPWSAVYVHRQAGERNG